MSSGPAEPPSDPSTEPPVARSAGAVPDRLPVPSRVRPGTPTQRHYDRLVRVAYLVLADSTEPLAGPGRRATDQRIARAHRVVRWSLPWRQVTDDEYLWLLARVVRRAANPPRFTVALPGHWGRPVPEEDDPQSDRLLAALTTLPTPVRAGYVLLVVEQLPPRDAIGVLHEAGWPDPVVQVAAGAAERQRLADTEGITPARQRHLLTGPLTDPMTVRLRPPDQRTVRWARLGRLAALATVLLATVAVTATLSPRLARFPPEVAGPAVDGTGAPAPDGIRRVGDQAWRGAARLSLASWPTRGSRTDDTALVTAALDSWLALAEATAGDPAARTAAHGATDPDGAAAGLAVRTGTGVVTAFAAPKVPVTAPVGAAHLVYAGELTGAGGSTATVAVLADVSRVAVFRTAGADRSVRIEPAPAADARAASAIRLSAPTEPARYLVAPWVRQVQSRSLAGGQWHELAVRSGVTDPVPAGHHAAADSGGCWAGPLLRMQVTEAGVDRPFTLADLGRVPLSRLSYLSPQRDPGQSVDDADTPAGARAWSGLGCLAGELSGHAPHSVLAWEVWAGTLPGRADEVRLTCVRAELPRDANLVAAVLLVPDAPARAVATAADTRLCSPLAPAVAVAWWWESPTGGWHHVTTSGGAVAQLEVTIRGQRQQGTGLLVSAAHPDGPVGPVRVRATDQAGRAVAVLD
ncbi:hypothetical protein O7608_28660 [Solwaraspora sp. WMMA2056]|uniref:hypothetical protein n=1 Tax=Solwaraspora sp. WMMA2056 TaxID=3015161 RepID=UPI00259B5C6F|nr:hypothetical protein [Solwaraspora sp. WMMA2056]WJK40329.1 hypothetical protein O7608_28660 [Solwaraspora sp. WMMA2056]